MTTAILLWGSIREPFVNKMLGNNEYLLSYTKGFAELPSPAQVRQWTLISGTIAFFLLLLSLMRFIGYHMALVYWAVLCCGGVCVGVGVIGGTGDGCRVVISVAGHTKGLFADITCACVFFSRGTRCRTCVSNCLVSCRKANHALCASGKSNWS